MTTIALFQRERTPFLEWLASSPDPHPIENVSSTIRNGLIDGIRSQLRWSRWEPQRGAFGSYHGRRDRPSCFKYVLTGKSSDHGAIVDPLFNGTILVCLELIPCRAFALAGPACASSFTNLEVKTADEVNPKSDPCMFGSAISPLCPQPVTRVPA